jgi:hypothetical protein
MGWLSASPIPDAFAKRRFNHPIRPFRFPQAERSQGRDWPGCCEFTWSDAGVSHARGGITRWGALNNALGFFLEKFGVTRPLASKAPGLIRFFYAC